MPGAQKLNPVDASFLHLETPNTHMHIGGCAIFEPSVLGGGAQHYDTLIRFLEPRLDAMPRYRQKLAFVPLALDTPVWVDDPDFDIHNHIVRAALPAPGTDRELQRYVSRVFSRPLDRRRPLWELYVIEGLAAGKWAILTKTHHAMVDGISNVELITVLMDISAAVPTEFVPSTWHAGEAPSGVELLLRSLRDRATRPARAVGAARAMLGSPARVATALRDTAGGLVAMAETVRAPKSVLNGKTGPTRRWTYTRFPLEDFRTVKGVFGGTINDVVLATVTGGLRRFLIGRGVNPETEPLQALCPVSLRTPADQGALGNRLAMLLVKLPVDEADPVRRLSRVRRTVDALKERKQAVGADFLLNLVGFAPSTIHALAARASLQAIGFNLVVTNVPGPQFPLYCLGSRMIEAFPAAFLYQGQHVAIAIFSYDGRLSVGVIADAHAMPDLEDLCADIEAGLAELVTAAREHTHTHAGPPPEMEIGPAPRRRAARKAEAAAAPAKAPLRRAGSSGRRAAAAPERSASRPRGT